MNQTTKANFFNQANTVVFTGIAVTMLFTLHSINSIFIILLAALWLLSGDFKTKFSTLRRDPLFWAYAFLFIVNAIGIFYAPDKAASWKNTESKLALLLIPLVFCSAGGFSANIKTRVFTYYTIILTAACIFCLAAAFIRYQQTGDTQTLFYHELVRPLKHHAVYFSAFTFISISFLLYEYASIPWLAGRKWLLVLWIAFLSGFVIMLSSKMALIVLVAFYFFNIFSKYAAQSKTRLAISVTAIVAGLLLVSTVNNPIKQRFTDLANGNKNIFTQEKFDPGDYFNGFQFRLLLWRCAYEILNEQDAWLLGVSAAEAQPILQKKYIQLNMYQGGNGSGDTGYLKYNFHNQYLQTTVQSGLLGLLSIFLWFGALLARTIRRKSAMAGALLTLLFFFFFTDSVFERQYGVVLTTIFPLLMLYAKPAEQAENTALSSLK